MVFVVVILVRVLVIVTYPLNLLRTDGPDYYHMLVNGVSNLILAPGYPFLMGLPFRNPLGRWLILNHPVVFEYILLILQHTINVLCLYLAYRVVRGLWGRLPATIFVVLYGLHFQILTVTSSMGPEWLQSSLVMLIAYLAYHAWGISDLRGKTLVWVLIGFVACWAFLVKFNTIFLLWIPAFAALLEVRRSRRTIIGPIAGVLVGLVTYGGFVLAFHRPTTGTSVITMDKACVLLQRVELQDRRRTMSPETGIETKRLLVLNALLPAPDHYRKPIPHVDFVDAEIREPYQRQYAHLLTADDQTLESYARELDLSQPFNFGRAYLPIAYHLGLAEANHLGTLVFIEHVRADPLAYLRSILRFSVTTLTEPKPFWIYPLSLKGLHPTPIGLGYQRLSDKPSRQVYFRYTRPIVWGPGVHLFSIHHRLFSWSPLWPTILILIGSAASAVEIWRKRHFDAGPIWYLVCALGLTSFIVCSNALLFFRWKEVPPVLPIVCALTSVSLTLIIRWIARNDVQSDADDARRESLGTGESENPGPVCSDTDGEVTTDV